METVSALAHMSRFAIVDLTDAKSILQELRGIVPERPFMAVQPILIRGQNEPGMFDYFRTFPWVLPTFLYDTERSLLAALVEKVINPAERSLGTRNSSDLA